VTGKYAGQRATVQTTPGSMPGFNDTFQKYPFIHTLSTTVNYTFNPTTFLEGTWGMGSNYLGAPPVSPYTPPLSCPASGWPIVPPRVYKPPVLDVPPPPSTVLDKRESALPLSD
jgi:hypothetical protein